MLEDSFCSGLETSETVSSTLSAGKQFPLLSETETGTPSFCSAPESVTTASETVSLALSLGKASPLLSETETGGTPSSDTGNSETPFCS
ncbi:hypothetical protein QQP08_022233 [Theobroma cacao]|nr:hypothetical protein QQP08_022233 [Theobroma cacao]